MPENITETYFSVDIETAGPSPGQYALLSIGACTITEPVETYYVEIQPDREAFLADALQVSGLGMEELRDNGLPPKQAIQQFADWVKKVVPDNSRPVFVAFNAPFDWMFVNDYFHRYLEHNPFGHSALDMKAYFMGARRVSWGDTGFEKIAKYYKIDRPLTHNALQDALHQADLFKKMLEEAKKNNRIE